MTKPSKSPMNPHSTDRVITKPAKQKNGRRPPTALHHQKPHRLITQAGKAIQMSPADLQAWIDHFPNLSDRAREITLQLIIQHGLDPKANEIDLVQYDADQWQPLITVNGWAKLINAQPTFCGIEFIESPEREEDIPRWMTCIIYRTDRIKPISVKEYLVELKTDHACWQEMPRRMLRYRAMQQCARLAFGIAVPEWQPIHGRSKKLLPEKMSGLQLRANYKNTSSTEFLKKRLMGD